MRFKKFLTLFLIFSSLFGRLVLGPQLNLVQALLVTYQTDFNTATWVNRSGSNTTSTTGSPFSIAMGDHTFLLSYGTRDGSNNTYFGSINNGNASSYFRLDLNGQPSRSILAPFEGLGDDEFEMVVAMNTSFYFINLDSMTLTWESIGAKEFTGKVIFSVNEGKTWQAYNTDFSLSRDTTPKSYNQNLNNVYNEIRLGYYFSVASLSTQVFQVKNPVISINYNQLNDADAANSLKEEVILYTPCVSDTDGLVLLTLAKKSELINKYNALSINAKSLFANISISGGYNALDRYLFLTK